MILGRVDEVDGHFVATKFVAGAVPTECLYISHDGKRDAPGVRIRPDIRSITLGYTRVWLPIVAIVAPVIQWLKDGAVAPATLVVSIVLVAMAISAFALGRLPEPEKVRLRMLGTVTGFRLDPARLHDRTRTVKRDQLGELMEKGGIPTTPEEIVSVIDDIPVPAMPLVYGYACYAGGQDDPAWRECAALVYSRWEEADAG